jgi:hypothetical protein
MRVSRQFLLPGPGAEENLLTAKLPHQVDAGIAQLMPAFADPIHLIGCKRLREEGLQRRIHPAQTFLKMIGVGLAHDVRVEEGKLRHQGTRCLLPKALHLLADCPSVVLAGQDRTDETSGVPPDLGALQLEQRPVPARRDILPVPGEGFRQGVQP